MKSFIMQKLEDITIWQNANKIAIAIYGATAKIDFGDEKELKKRLENVVSLVPKNIAKGYEEKIETKEAISFLKQAKKAAQDTRAQVYDAFEQHYISKEDFDYFYNELAHLSSAIGKNIITLKFPNRK